MSNYIPKLSHAILTALIGILFTGLLANDTPWANAYLVGAIAFLMMSALIFALMFGEQRRLFYQTMSDFMEQLARLNPDQWNALGLAFPRLSIRWSGKPILFWEDVAAMEHFERFMRDSSSREISPERNWSTGPERRTWRLIKDKLESMGYIYADSARGNHSWLWRANMRDIVWQRYIIEQVQDLNQLEQEAAI